MYARHKVRSSDDGSDGLIVEGVRATRARSAKSVGIKTEPFRLPEPCEEKLPTFVSLKLLLTPSDSKEEVELSTDQLKKRRRNERDRRRSCAKRETIEQMRKTMAALLLPKQQLIQHTGADSPYSTPGDRCRPGRI